MFVLARIFLAVPASPSCARHQAILNFMCFLLHPSHYTFVCFYCFCLYCCVFALLCTCPYSTDETSPLFERFGQAVYVLSTLLCFFLSSLFFRFFSGETTKVPLNKTMGAGQVIRIPGELTAPRAIKTFCYLIKSRAPLRWYDVFPQWTSHKWTS